MPLPRDSTVKFLSLQLVHNLGAGHHKRVRRLMGEMGLLQRRKRSQPRTTDSNHPYPRYPNRVQSLTITYPDQVWVADITYVRLGTGHVYLAIIMDVYTSTLSIW